MHDDFISRKQAIDEATQEGAYGYISVEELAKLPSAQQWIPCSERLPDKAGAYLVTCNGNLTKKKLKVLSLCSGIGCSERGIENSGVFDFDMVATAEIDKFAVLSYAAIHCGLNKDNYHLFDYPDMDTIKQYLTDINLGYDPLKNEGYNWFKSGKKHDEFCKKCYAACQLSKNVGDVSRVKELPYADLWFLSFPCTDLSIAGRQAGMDKGSNTRSSLVWETIRLLTTAKENNTLPQYMILENVKALVCKKYIKQFEAFNDEIRAFGYNVRWQVLNAKDCGLPQNRERVFAVYIREDVDTGLFQYPAPFDNGLRLKDVLEDKVDEKYYINTEKAEALIVDLLDRGVIGDDNLESRAEQRPIDLSANKPQEISIANCIMQRENRGIATRPRQGSGVCELQAYRKADRDSKDASG